MLQNLFSIHQFRLTKWNILVSSTTPNAPYIHPSHDSILELWRTFPNDESHELSPFPAELHNHATCQHSSDHLHAQQPFWMDVPLLSISPVSRGQLVKMKSLERYGVFMI